MLASLSPFFFFFFNDTATTEIYTLSLHDALPISRVLGGSASPGHGGRAHSVDRRRRAAVRRRRRPAVRAVALRCHRARADAARDRKSTRLNSSHGYISYAVFCLKKKKQTHVRDAAT